MTRGETEHLRTIHSLIDSRNISAKRMLWRMIQDAEREFAAEDRHNDWAELAQQPHQIAAE